MIRSPAARALIALALACFLGACTGSYRTLVHVDTVHADVAAYAERYNLSQDRYRVVTRFANAPAESLAHGGSDADVLIGPGLAGRDLAETLLPLDGLFRSGLLRASAFFPSLLESGRADGVLRALPLSFRVPVIAVRAGRDDLPSFSVTPDELAALGPASRSWSAELVYQAAVLYGADFRRLPDGRLGLRQAAVDRAVDQARRWFEAEPGGLPSDTLPPVQMLLDGRIEFFLTDLHRFVDIPAERRDQLAMRWLGSGEGLLAADDLTYAAIRARAPNARGAQAFLLWLFEPATQAALLELGRREHLAGFGIAGGLPAGPGGGGPARPGHALSGAGRARPERGRAPRSGGARRRLGTAARGGGAAVAVGRNPRCRTAGIGRCGGRVAAAARGRGGAGCRHGKARPASR